MSLPPLNTYTVFIQTHTNSIMSMGNISSASNILTDFVVDWDELTSYNGTVQYSPVGEYRLVDLIGNDNMSNRYNFPFIGKMKVITCIKFF